MPNHEATQRLYIDGMSCSGCQDRIQRQLQATAGIESVKVSYMETTADICYDTSCLSLAEIIEILRQLGYTATLHRKSRKQTVPWREMGVLALIVVLYILLQEFGVLNLLVPSQLADGTMGYGMLVVTGLITSFHCIAMCGGINLSQCLPKNKTRKNAGSGFQTFIPALAYNLGRVISYTVTGFILGFAGLLFGSSTNAGIPVLWQGILKIVAGIFMVIMGVNLLQLFPVLRKFHIRLPWSVQRKIHPKKAEVRSSLVIGLLNGLMPCGPLQSMQMIALASGSPLLGALSMFLFSIGTVPLMLGFGAVISALGKQFTEKILYAGGILVAVLGLAMLSQGGSLSGLLSPGLLLFLIFLFCGMGMIGSFPFSKAAIKKLAFAVFLCVAAVGFILWPFGMGHRPENLEGSIQIIDGWQVVYSTLDSGRYPSITVQTGIPVRWIIQAPEGTINGCNNRIFIHAYGIEYSFRRGENVIEFDPGDPGTRLYSCWMGMIYGQIIVTDS